MKVIHSFASNTKIPKIDLCTAILSAHYAKKHYGNINLYSNSSFIKPIKDLGLEYLYDSITPIEYTSDEMFCWSVPKLKTYASINEPFLHIDLDTVMFNKLEFGNKNVFSYQDQAKYYPSTDSEGEILNKFLTGVIGYDAQYKLYLNYYFKLWNEFDSSFKSLFSLNSIPNMSIVYCKNYKLINQASVLALEFFNKHKISYNLVNDIDCVCFLEQFLVHHFMRVLSSEYTEVSNRGEHVIFKSEPFYLKSEKTSSFEYVTLDITKQIDVTKNFSDFFNDNMRGFFHPSFYRHRPVVEAYILYKLENIIGNSKLKEISNYYSNSTLTEGEQILLKYKKKKII